MPAFCRHSRLVQNCPICSREQNVQMNAVVTSSTPKVSESRPARPSTASANPSKRLGGTEKPRSTRSSPRGGVVTRRLERGAEDGYSSPLVQGLKSSADAERLADELAFAATRLRVIGTDRPDVFAEIIAAGDLEEQTWRAVQFVLASEDPVSWSSGEELAPYRAWIDRTGSQEAAFTGESYWTPERRFERVFERLGSLAVFDRAQRFDLLAVLGSLGLYELQAGKLLPGGENETTWAAKRAFGIGDTLLLERRAADLANEAGVPIAALDLGLHNWGGGSAARTGRGVTAELEPDQEFLESAHNALGV